MGTEAQIVEGNNTAGCIAARLLIPPTFIIQTLPRVDQTLLHQWLNKQMLHRYATDQFLSWGSLFPWVSGWQQRLAPSGVSCVAPQRCRQAVHQWHVSVIPCLDRHRFSSPLTLFFLCCLRTFEFFFCLPISVSTPSPVKSFVKTKREEKTLEVSSSSLTSVPTTTHYHGAEKRDSKQNLSGHPPSHSLFQNRCALDNSCSDWSTVSGMVLKLPFLLLQVPIHTFNTYWAPTVSQGNTLWSQSHSKRGEYWVQLPGQMERRGDRQCTHGWDFIYCFSGWVAGKEKKVRRL